MKGLIAASSARIVPGDVPGIVVIEAENMVNTLAIVLKQQELVDEIVRYLCMIPEWDRQAVIDELTARTLRTLEDPS